MFYEFTIEICSKGPTNTQLVLLTILPPSCQLFLNRYVRYIKEAVEIATD